MTYALSTNKRISPLLSNANNRSTWLRKADSQMTKELAPYEQKIRWLNEERSKISVGKTPNQQYYNTAVYNASQKRKKIDKAIDKTNAQMEERRQEIIRARRNWKKLLRTTKA